MASFASAAFSTSSFSPLAFDFDGSTPATVVTDKPTGGWTQGKRDLFFTPRKYSVKTDTETKYFDTAEEALAYLDSLQKPEPKAVRSLGKAFPVFYADKPVIDYMIGRDSGAQVLREANLRRIRILERLIEKTILDAATEEEEMLLLVAAVS